jgi:hypothetical protein
MTLLNLTKFKKEPAAEAPKVPDELPPLPDAKPAEVPAAPAPQPVVAPPELPPIAAPVIPPAPVPVQPQPAPVIVEAAPQPQVVIVEEKKAPVIEKPVIQAAKPQTIEQKIDARLYFFGLITKLHDNKTKDNVEKELLNSTPAEIINRMSSQWEIQKKEDRLVDIEKRITEIMPPLESMEYEWRTLKNELTQKGRRINDIEENIRKSTEELKHLISEKSKLNNELLEH